MMSEFTQIFIDLSGLRLIINTPSSQVKGEARDNLVSSLLGTWLKGGVGRDLFKVVWVKGHDV